jgi:hypothetical protein
MLVIRKMPSRLEMNCCQNDKDIFDVKKLDRGLIF